MVDSLLTCRCRIIELSYAVAYLKGIDINPGGKPKKIPAGAVPPNETTREHPAFKADLVESIAKGTAEAFNEVSSHTQPWVLQTSSERTHCAQTHPAADTPWSGRSIISPAELARLAQPLGHSHRSEEAATVRQLVYALQDLKAVTADAELEIIVPAEQMTEGAANQNRAGRLVPASTIRKRLPKRLVTQFWETPGAAEYVADLRDPTNSIAPTASHEGTRAASLAAAEVSRYPFLHVVSGTPTC